MDHIKLWPISVCFAIALHCLASSVAQVLPVDSVLSGSNNSIIFYRAGENGYYGNNVTVRTTSLPDSANKAWFDEETLLPNGTLKKFYLMAHIYSYGTLDDASTRIRLQIWRPVDIINYRLMLVWQQVVQVAASAQAPLLYTYTINQTVALVAGDRIGWAFEGRAGPISFAFVESHRTRLQSPKFSALPQVGQTIDFDPVYLPSIFSVAVSVDGILPGYPGSASTVGITGATSSPGATGATVPVGSSGPLGTPGGGTVGATGAPGGTGSEGASGQPGITYLPLFLHLQAILLSLFLGAVKNY